MDEQLSLFNNKKTKVVHCKKEPFDVYIGRPSEFGNPYSYKDKTIAQFRAIDRNDAIEKYKQYLYNNKELQDKIKTLKGKTLGCWCAPKRCHGDVIAEFLDSDQSQNT